MVKVKRKKGYYLVQVRGRTIARVKRVPAVIRIAKQSGTRKSFKLDKRRRAMPPGMRISKAGRIYYEYRRNRSDKKGKRI